jgi:hypothetical protein
MRSDGYVRAMLTLIAGALLALVAIEAGWLGRAPESQAGRFQYAPLRYGPLGNFVVRFDTATGKLERVRFPANDVVWQEIGVVPAGHTAVPDALASEAGQPAPKLPMGLFPQLQAPVAPAPPAPPTPAGKAP